MLQIQICPQGHRWDPAHDSRPSVEARWSSCPQCGAAPEAYSLHDTPRPDDSSPTVPGPALPPSVPGYDILGEVGRGGMGVIYRARHVASGRHVALKMISAGAHAAPADIARFRHEVEAVSRLRHPNIVQVFEVGDLNGLPFVALEFMDKGSLAQSLGNSALPPRFAAELIELMARAIQAAHDAGILHRDIKPANVLLSSPPDGVDEATLPAVVRLIGVPKLTDFGLAKRIGEANVITRTGAVLGTPAYMAPELAEGQSGQATTAVDVYSLGAVLYECLTGKAPFEGPTALQTLDRVRRGDPVPPDRLVPDLPAPLVTVCLGAMARDPARRYSSAGAMADDLRRFLDDRPVTARREPAWSRAARWIGRHPVVAGLSAAIAVVGTLCVVLAIAALRLAGGGTTPTEDTSVEYYGGVVRRFGVPEGVYRLNDEQVNRREVSFRVHRRGKQVEKVEAVDRHGRPTTRHSFVAYLERGDGDQPFRRECRWEYQVEGGELKKETAYDRTGQVMWAFLYTTDKTGHYTDRRGFPRARAGSGAAYVSFVYSSDGLVKELRYLNANGRPRADRNGVFGQRHDHDERGFVVGISFLGAEDQPVLHPDGYAREVRRYDVRGNRVETAYVGLDALPMLGPSGLARKTTAYDADGNLTEVRAYGIDGNLTRRSEGYAIERRTYDGSGLLKSIAHLDVREKPARDQFGVARHAFSYADEGRRVEESFFDRDDKPVKHRMLACTRLTRVFEEDDDGQPSELIAHDLDQAARRELRFGLPAPHVKRKHDARGNLTDEWYFDLDGKPTLSWFGVHRVHVTYTDRGQRSEMRFEDADGKAAVPQASGTVESLSGRGPGKIVWKWDDSGNNVEIQALTLAGEPDDSWALPVLLGQGPREGELTLPSGVAKVTGKYDERGNVTEVSHLDREGQILPALKSARNVVSRGRLVLSYDEHGNMNEAALYGPDGALAADVGVSRISAQHDEDGRPLEYALYGPEGRMAGSAGISKFRFTYDRQGNRTSEAYFDAEDRPMAGPSGYAEAKFLYDLGGNLTESKFYDVSGGAVMTRVVVERVAEDGPAVDLKAGDVLTRYAEQGVTHTMQLHELKRREDPGRPPREAEVMRDGKAVMVKLPTGFLGSDGSNESRRRWGRSPGGSPFWMLRALPTPGLTPPMTFGGARLRTEVVR